MLIDWSSIRDPRSLVNSLSNFLVEVFSEEFLREEVKKLDLYTLKSKPESLEYLRPIGVHRAAKWFKLLEKIRERDYSFDLKFSTEIEEFMNLMLFTYALDTLIQYKVLSLKNPVVSSSLRDRDRFETLLYEVLVASNYTLNGFEVSIPDLLNRDHIDVYAKKGNIEVYCECKKLRRRELYTDLAIKIISRLYQKKLNLIVDLELLRKPRSIENIVELVEKAAEEGKPIRTEDVVIQIQPLPELIEGVYEISIPRPHTIEYAVSATPHTDIFNGVLRVEEPKILVIRDSSKPKYLEKRLKSKLREAYDQLRTVSSRRKVIYVDISEVAGKIVFQLPELIRLTQGPEILASHLEITSREWLEIHPDIDAIVLTKHKLYIDEFGNPYAITLENQNVLAYTAPGWTIEMRVIPMPRNAFPEILVDLGVEVARRGNYSMAITYFKEAIRMNPNLKEAYNNLGRILNDLGRPDEALKYLEAALKIDRNYVLALVNRGIAFTELGRYNEALIDFERALSLDPNNEKAWYNKALVHLMLGQRDEAYKCVLKALGINPNYEYANELRELIEKQHSARNGNNVEKRS